jgi:hypothetical protein
MLREIMKLRKLNLLTSSVFLRNLEEIGIARFQRWNISVHECAHDNLFFVNAAKAGLIVYECTHNSGYCTRMLLTNVATEKLGVQQCDHDSVSVVHECGRGKFFCLWFLPWQSLLLMNQITKKTVVCECDQDKLLYSRNAVTGKSVQKSCKNRESALAWW